MIVERIPCPFRDHDGCNSGGGKGLTKRYFIDHLGSRHLVRMNLSSFLKIMLQVTLACSPPWIWLLQRQAFGFVGYACAPTPLVRIAGMSTVW